jgi:GxxExxY protein
VFCAQNVGAHGNFTTEGTEEDKKEIKVDRNEISGAIVDAAMKVHSALGPGLLESAYAACLRHELIKRGLKVAAEVPVPVVYDGIRLDAGYKLDLLVEDTVVVELKAIEALAPIHQAQIISYLKLTGKPIGLLINFHSLHLKDGIKRFVV